MRKFENGDKIGVLTIIEAYIRTDGKKSWHKCQCECGNIREIRTDSLRATEKCSCNRGKRIIKIGDKFGPLTVIEPYYERSGNHSLHKCKCQCGLIKEYRTDQLKELKTTFCNPFLQEGLHFQKTIYNGQKFGLLTVIDSYCRNDERGPWHKCQCECGNIVEYRTDQLKNIKIPSCGCNYTNKKKDEKGDKYGKLTIIDAYIRTDGKKSWHRCQCECGRIIEVGAWSLHSGKTKSCGCINSKGELKIKQILDFYNADYEQQYSFDDLLGDASAHLFFDFAVFENDKIKFLIEYNGEQHYEPIDFFGGQERFDKQQRYDNYKIEYCEDNDIPLLIIPYWDYDKIEEILLNKLKEVNNYATS